MSTAMQSRNASTAVDTALPATPVKSLAYLGLVGALLLAATVSGEILFAVAENGNASFQSLIVNVALPAIGILVVLTIVSALVGFRRLARGVVLGALFGVLATAALELVRNIGFYKFQSMPGQLPELMGVFMTNRIMDGPDLLSNLLGWADHAWNGATLGITYALIMGGAPRTRRHWSGAVFGSLFGVIVGTGFLLSPVSRATGAGIFGSIEGMKYVYTVYLAHIAFGASLGVLVHRFGSRIPPVWQVAARLLPRRVQPNVDVSGTPPLLN